MTFTFPTRARGRAAAAAAAFAVAVLALSGCASGSSEAASSGDASAEGFGELTVQLSWIKNEEFAGEFFADAKGYYTDAGFDVGDARARPVDRSRRADLGQR